jgi:hypothetical protein
LHTASKLPCTFYVLVCKTWKRSEEGKFKNYWSKYSLKVKVRMLGVLTWSGFILLEWDVDIIFGYDEPYIPECKEKDLLLCPFIFGKVI